MPDQPFFGDPRVRVQILLALAADDTSVTIQAASTVSSSDCGVV
jgi:hypothetical protein